MKETLMKLQNNEISVKKAYKLLYKKKKIKRAKFVKMRIHLKDRPLVTMWLRLLFLLPWPIFIVRRLLKKQLVNWDATFYKGHQVSVNIDEVIIFIKAI